MNFDVAYAWEVLPVILSAARITLLATGLGMLLALCIGAIFAAAGRSAWRVVRLGAGGFSVFLRATPLLVQLYFLYYILPLYGVSMSPLLTGLLGLGLQYGAYVGEIYRAGIDSIPPGQTEAAAALGLRRMWVWVHVILPQVVPRVLPALGNNLIGMFKSTPYLAAITVNEMLGAALDEASQSFRYLEPLLITGGLFMAASYLSAGLIFALEAATGLRRTR